MKLAFLGVILKHFVGNYLKICMHTKNRLNKDIDKKQSFSYSLLQIKWEIGIKKNEFPLVKQ